MQVWQQHLLFFKRSGSFLLKKGAMGWKGGWLERRPRLQLSNSQPVSVYSIIIISASLCAKTKISQKQHEQTPYLSLKLASGIGSQKHKKYTTNCQNSAGVGVYRSDELQCEIQPDVAKNAVNHTPPEKLHSMKSREWEQREQVTTSGCWTAQRETEPHFKCIWKQMHMTLIGGLLQTIYIHPTCISDSIFLVGALGFPFSLPPLFNIKQSCFSVFGPPKPWTSADRCSRPFRYFLMLKKSFSALFSPPNFV